MGLIRIEGKDVSVPDDIIDAGIPAIKAALSVDFPAIENADIDIVRPTRAGAPRTASVVKRGTGKGTLNITGASSIPKSKSTSISEHLVANSITAISELLRRVSETQRQQVVLQLTRLVSPDAPDIEMYWLVVVGGPFASEADALDALGETANTKPQVLQYASRLRRDES